MVRDELSALHDHHYNKTLAMNMNSCSLLMSTMHCVILVFLIISIVAAAVPIKAKGPSTPQSPHELSRMSANAQPKSHHTGKKPKEKVHRESRRRKMHDGVREQSHRMSHHLKDGSKAGISKDGLRDGPKEIPHEVVRDRDREAYLLAAGHAGLHAHRDGPSRHSASAGRRPGSKHAEGLKPAPSHALVTVQRRLSSDSRPVAGAEMRLTSGVRAEAKLSAKVV